MPFVRSGDVETSSKSVTEAQAMLYAVVLRFCF